jgi:hypothetical protein
MMRKDDDMNLLRDKLSNAKLEAPDFEMLFRDEILGDASLRSVCQQKLIGHTEKAPSFNSMFGQELLGKPAPILASKKPSISLWSIGVFAVAASLALMLILPSRMNMQMDNRTQNTAIEKSPLAAPVRKHIIAAQKATLYTQKIPTPSTINTLSTNHKKAVIPEIQDIGQAETEANQRDTTTIQPFTRIAPSSKSNLTVHQNRSVQEAYAEAKTAKSKNKREKMILGANFNGSNRLLSMTNTKSGEFGLSSVANTYADGFNQLEGTTSLRTATSSKNEWEAPENIAAAALLNGEDKYFLPLNFGLTISIPLFNYTNLITGLNYAYIGSKTTGSNTAGTFELKRELHYIGIPLRISFNFLKRGPFDAYIGVGGMVEKGLSGVQKSVVTDNNDEKNTWNGSQKIYGFQTSLSGQLGISYELNKTFRLYAEPGVAYFIASDQPVSSRTEEPLSFNLSLGLRYCIQ